MITQLHSMPREIDNLTIHSDGTVNYVPVYRQIMITGELLANLEEPYIIDANHLKFGDFIFEHVADYFAGDCYLYRLVNP